MKSINGFSIGHFGTFAKTALFISLGASLALSIALVPSFVKAAEVVVPSGESVQDAINNASPGDTIVLEANGSYSGFTVNQSLTIVGAGLIASEDPVISGAVTITSDDVSVSGLIVENPTGSFGILIDGRSNVSVTGNLVQNVGSDSSYTVGSAQGIYLNGGAGASITGVEISGNTIKNIGHENLLGQSGFGTSAKGIYVGDTNGTGAISVIISGNIVSDIKAATSAFGNPGGRGAYGVLINFGGSTTATISNNSFTDLEGLWVHVIGLEKNTPNTTISNNTIGSFTDHKTPTDGFAVFFESNPGMTTTSLDGVVLGGTTEIAVNADWTGYSNNPVVSLDGNDYLFGVNAFATIAEAISAVSAGGIVTVSGGTFAESVVVNKEISLVGAGDDSITGTIIDVSGAGTGLSISADNVSVSGIRIEKQGSGKAIETTVSVTNLTLDEVTATNASAGFRVGSGVTIDGLIITNSHFDGNTQGWYFAKETEASAAADVTNVSVTNTTFSDNSQKGIYVEKLSNATFDGIVVENSGTDAGYGFNAGIDINLKWAAYSNIEFRNSSIINSGLTGTATNPLFPVGLTIKARDDGSYGTTPATLADVTIEKVSFVGGVNSVRIGEPGKDNAGPSNVVITDSAFTGMTGYAVINESLSQVDARGNWWGSADAPEDGVDVSGDVLVDPFASAAGTLELSSGAVTAGGSSTLSWTSFPGVTLTVVDGVTESSSGSKTVSPSGVGTHDYTAVFTDAVGTESSVTVTLTVSGGAGGGGGGSSGGGSGSSTTTTPPATTETTTETTTTTTTETTTETTSSEEEGEVLGAATYNFTVSFGQGSSGEMVTELQNLLTTLGLYSGPVTGYFGPLTLEAVKKFQAENGIVDTGFVGELTLTALNESSGETTTPTFTGTLSTEQRTAILITLTDILAQIQAIQARLNQLQAQGL